MPNTHDPLAVTDTYDTIEHPRIWVIEIWAYTQVNGMWGWRWVPTHFNSTKREEAKAMHVYFPDTQTRLRSYVRLIT